MLHTIDMLKAAVQRQSNKIASPSSITGEIERSDDITAVAERSRSPLTITRAVVRADMTEMMRYFGTDLDELPLYRDELLEAEDLCARCRQVGRCRRWHMRGHHGDAPRLFCANVALFEEITSDPFWNVCAPGQWHGEAAASPLLHLLASMSPGRSDQPPDLRASKLKAFVGAAIQVDTLIDEWTSRIETAPGEQEATRLRDRLEAVMDAAIENTARITTEEFQRILQVALCDPDLAGRLCRLFKRMSRRQAW